MSLSAADPVPGTPLWWLHGFTQSAHSAHRFRDILAVDRQLPALDLPRHGANREVGGSLDEIATWVWGQIGDGSVDLGGYSFGARIALHVALQRPEQVRRLVLLSGTRGIKDDSLRSARIERDRDLADRIEEIGAESFIDEWMSQPMFAELAPDEDERQARAGQDAHALAQSLREAGTGIQRYLGDELSALSCPVLVLAGVTDVRFAREASEIARSVPQGAVTLIAGAGHAAHIRQPTQCAAIVNSFLA